LDDRLAKLVKQLKRSLSHLRLLELRLKELMILDYGEERQQESVNVALGHEIGKAVRRLSIAPGGNDWRNGQRHIEKRNRGI
jgi:hypothetical protein